MCIFVHDNHDHDNHDHACHHGGMCRARRHGFYCECLPGFMGTRCEGLFRVSFSSQCAFSNTESMITIVKAISITSTIMTIMIAIIMVTLAIMEECVGHGVMGSIVSVYQVLWAQEAKVCFEYLFQVSVHFPILIQ